MQKIAAIAVDSESNVQQSAAGCDIMRPNTREQQQQSLKGMTAA